MPLNVRSILQGGSDITLKSFFKIRQDKEKKKNKNPNQTSNGLLPSFPRPFQTPAGVGEGLRVSSHDFLSEGTT